MAAKGGRRKKKQEPMTKFIKEVEIAGAIVIPIIGKARIYVDNEGVVYAEIEYNVEVMDKAIDRGLLPILEEATGISHFRSAHDNTPVKSSGALLSFRIGLRDKDYCFKFMKEKKL